jgi:hypothetical protein
MVTGEEKEELACVQRFEEYAVGNSVAGIVAVLEARVTDVWACECSVLGHPSRIDQVNFQEAAREGVVDFLERNTVGDRNLRLLYPLVENG